jgi:hypothetical protein
VLRQSFLRRNDLIYDSLRSFSILPQLVFMLTVDRLKRILIYIVVTVPVHEMAFSCRLLDGNIELLVAIIS